MVAGWRCVSILASCFWVLLPAQAYQLAHIEKAKVETYFSPRDGATRALVDLIDKAERRVWLAGYGFSSDAIGDALVKAQQRGLDVRVVLDKTNRKLRESQAAKLKAADVDVRTNHRYAIMHHKFALIDSSLALGSMNFTSSGENRNAENMNIFSGAEAFTTVFDGEFLRLYEESQVFTKYLAPSPEPIGEPEKMDLIAPLAQSSDALSNPEMPSGEP